MCGVSGVVAKTEAVEARREVALMNAAVRHRGPDGEGIFSRPGLALGHRRLAILDLSEHGHQPMQRGDRYWITYNGEIYNYRELREELVTMGETFHSGSDTEVILAAYAHWGADCVHRFNGMWAFVIYDALEECLFLSRDRFGVKPLYYVDTPSRFAFGSEIKQLLPQLPTIRANREVLLHSLLTGIDDHTHETYFAEVLSFPQGHRGTYDLRTNRLTMEPWYALKSATEVAGLSDTEATEQFRTLFEDAVRLRMRADVKVGTCLSGGLDSSATSSVASRIYHESSANRFLAIHAKSTERETDESLHARRAADALGIELHVVEPTIAEFFDTIDELSHTQEEPFGSASQFMGWHVFQKARELGCPVMLNGQGGDEVLLGYERYFAAQLRALPWYRWPQSAHAFTQHSNLSHLQLLQYYLYFRLPEIRIARLKARSFVRPELKRLVDFRIIRESAKTFSDVRSMQQLEITSVQLPHLLRYEDRNSMRHSIEARLPFLDYRLVEFSVGLPATMKLRDGWSKYVLRDAMRGELPPEIVWRRDKLGFEAPMRTWLNAARTRMRDAVRHSALLREITEHRRLMDAFDALPLKEQWRYFNLATWERVFGVESWA